ncbi:MAG: hypothetical protein ABEJ35_00050 [Halobacteriaceae archaeon]
MRVRNWTDIVEDVVESNADPDGWRAVGGDRRGGVGEVLYLGHPSAGVFQLKTFAKNPFEVQGVGTQVARRVDEDLDSLLPTSSDGRFAVQQPPQNEDEAESVANRLEAVVEAHAEAPTSPEDFIDDALDAMESPAYGPMKFDQYGRPESLEELADTFEEPESVLDAELDELIDDADVGRGIQ